MSVVKSQKYSFQFWEVACFKWPGQGLFHPKAAYQTMFQRGRMAYLWSFFSFFLHCTLSPFLPAFQLESGSRAAYAILLFLPVESLVVLEELPEGLEEEPELGELDEVVPVRIVGLGHRLHVVEAAVDGGDRVKQLVHRDHVTHALQSKFYLLRRPLHYSIYLCDLR